MLDIQQLEEKFSTEYCAIDGMAMTSTMKETEIETEKDEGNKDNNEEIPIETEVLIEDEEDYEEEFEDHYGDQYVEGEEEPDKFEPVSIPLFDPKVWDDKELIRNMLTESTQKNKPGSKQEASSEATTIKPKITRVNVGELNYEGRAPTYDRLENPQIPTKRAASDATKNRISKNPRNEKQNEHYLDNEIYSEKNNADLHNSAFVYPADQGNHEVGSCSQGQSMPLIPPASMVPSDDEALNNMINAWYFAGYYSAIYQMKK